MKTPTIEEIEAYIVEKNLNVDAKLFWLKNEERAERKNGQSVWMRGRHPMKRWKMVLQIHHEGGWCRTAHSDNEYRNRNAARMSREKYREDFGDLLRSKNSCALEDMLDSCGKDGYCGQVPTWLIREILKEKRAAKPTV
jgi:hypothetical protein